MSERLQYELGENVVIPRLGDVFDLGSSEFVSVNFAAPQHAAQGEVLLTALLDQSERIYRLLRELERGGIQDDTQMLKLEIMKEDLRTLADKWQGLLR